MKNRIITMFSLIMIIGNIWSESNLYAADDLKLRNSLEKEVDKLEPEVIRLRSLDSLKKQRDTLKLEKEGLTNDIAGEPLNKITKDLELLKSEVSRLKPISEL
jgi:hypothetical protein